MTTDPRRPHPRRAPALAPILALGVLLVVTAACSSGGGDERVAAGSDDQTATSTTTTTAAGSGGAPSKVDGKLALAAGRGGVMLTVTAGAQPLLVLADLSLATVDADGSSWSVVVARPDGPRSSTADLPDTFAGVVAQPGESVEVGPYGLGPRPPKELRICLEVVTATAAQANGTTGDEVLLPAATGSPSTLCARTPVG